MSDTTQLADQFLHDCSISPDDSYKVSKGKSVSYVVDLNQGSYNSGIVTIDATNQLTGSQGYASLKDGYITVPYVATLKNIGAGSLGASSITDFVAGMKCNTTTIIDKVQIEINGKSIITASGYLSHWNNLRAMTEWSADEINKMGASAFLYPDDVSSIGFLNTVPASSGDGYFNNATNATANLLTGTVTGPEIFENTGYIKRVLSNPPVVANKDGAVSPMNWASCSSTAAATISAQTGKGATVLASGAAGTNLATFHYLHRIRLVDIHPIFKEMDLVSNPQVKLTLYINTGVATVDVSATNAMSLNSVVLTQGNTCPVMISSGASGNGMAGVLNSTATQLQLAWGVMGNALTTTASAAQYYPYSTTRLYLPFYDLKPEKALEIVKQPVKKCKFLDYYVQSFKGQAGLGVQPNSFGANFSFQMSNATKNAKYVALLPFANTAAVSGVPTNYKTAVGIDQYASPFDSAPWTCQPGSCITNFNVQVGNKWVYNAAQSYDFQGFLDEFCKIGALNGAQTHEMANGLIDEDKWQNAQRILVADVSRITEKDVPNSILVSGTNSASQGVDCIVIIAYEREMSLNRITGELESYI